MVPTEHLGTPEPMLQVNWEQDTAACLACLEIYQSSFPSLEALLLCVLQWPVADRVTASQVRRLHLGFPLKLPVSQFAG